MPMFSSLKSSIPASQRKHASEHALSYFCARLCCADVLLCAMHPLIFPIGGGGGGGGGGITVAMCPQLCEGIVVRSQVLCKGGGRCRKGPVHAG